MQRACPRRASRVPVSPHHLCVLPLPIAPYLSPRPAGTAGYGERQGCGCRARTAWRHILPACTLAWCLPALCSVGRGEADTGIEATETPSQRLVSRCQPGEPWPWLSSSCLASSWASHMPVSMACCPPGFWEARDFPSALGSSNQTLPWDPQQLSPGENAVLQAAALQGEEILHQEIPTKKGSALPRLS